MTGSFFPCSRLRRYLLEADLTDPLSDEMVRHLEACSRCRVRWEGLQRTYRLLADGGEGIIGEGIIPESRVEIDRILDRLRQDAPTTRQDAPPSPRPRAKPLYRRTLPLALGAAVLLALVLRPIRLPPPSTKGRSRVSVSPRERPRVSARPAAPAPRPPLQQGRGKIPRTPRTAELPGITAGPPSLPLRAFASPRKRGADRTRTARARTALRPAPRPPAPRGSWIAPTSGHPARREAALLLRPVNRDEGFISLPPPLFAARSVDRLPHPLRRVFPGDGGPRPLVDFRLDRPVSVALLGEDLGTLLQALERQTGVPFSARGDLGPLPLTALVTDRPARDVMRQVARLFPLDWLRLGSPGRYRYELTPSLARYLIDEKASLQASDRMFLGLLGQLEALLPYLDAPPERLRALASAAEAAAEASPTPEERHRWIVSAQRLHGLADPRVKDAVRLVTGLPLGLLQQLREGKAVHLTDDRLPAPVAARLRQEFLSRSGPERPPAPLASDTRSDTLSVGYRFQTERPAPDRLLLKGVRTGEWTLASGDRTRSEIGFTLAEGRPEVPVPTRPASPAGSPHYASAALLGSLAQRLSLLPRPRTPLPDLVDRPQTRLAFSNFVQIRYPGQFRRFEEDRSEWIDSADLFREVHERAGVPLLAAYTHRLYPAHFLQFRNQPLLKMIQATENMLELKWIPSDGFWNFQNHHALSEQWTLPPVESFLRWQDERRRQGGLSLDSLAEIAALPASLLGDPDRRAAVMVRFGLEEWPLAGSAKDELLAYGTLSPDLRALIRSPGGLPFSRLTPTERLAWLSVSGFDPRALSAEEVLRGRLGLRLRPAGRYSWSGDDGMEMLLAPIEGDSLQEVEAKRIEWLQEHGLEAMGAPRIAGPAAGIRFEARVGGRTRIRERNGLFGNRSRTLQTPADP